MNRRSKIPPLTARNLLRFSPSLAHIARRLPGGDSIQSKPKRRRSRLTFAEALALGGVAAVCRTTGSAVASTDDVFAAIGDGLRKNYQGEAFEFDRTAFDAALKSISTAGRLWTRTKRAKNLKLSPTVRLTTDGERLAATLPVLGTALTADDERRFESRLNGKPMEPAGDRVKRLMAGAIIEAITKIKSAADARAPPAAPP